MATVFWDRHGDGVLLCEIMLRGDTMILNPLLDPQKTATRYSQPPERLIIKREVFDHDNPRPHVAAATQEIINSFG